MFFKTAILSAFALAAANGVMGAALPSPQAGEGQVSILVATDAYFACNCPNNCSHKQGTGCRYFSGPSDSSDVISGTCNYPNGNHLAGLECIV